MMIASGLIDWMGRRRLIYIGFGAGSATLFLLSIVSNTILHSKKQKSEWNYSLIVLGLACLYTISLCVGWLALDCLSAESFPTKVRSTGRGVCVATGRIAGFCVQFLYGPLVNQNRLGYMMGLAGVFAMGGMAMACKTTDTTNIDMSMQDNWDYASTESASSEGEDSLKHERPKKRISFAETKHSEYLSISIEQNL